MSFSSDFLVVLRPKQWTKNLFVLSPLCFAGEAMNAGKAYPTLAAALLFCVCSSAVYIFNDIVDRESDRFHVEKRQRPIAAGRVKPGVALALASPLCLVGLGGSLLLTWRLFLIVAIYIGVNLFYSLKLKHVAILDVLCISAGFLLRVLAGGTVADVYISSWLLVCTLSLSIFLAFGKRRQELTLSGDDASSGRRSLDSYSLSFLDQAIPSAATITIITYLLYVADQHTAQFFGTRAILVTIFFVIYGVFRYLNLVLTYKRSGDPASLLFSDRPLFFCCLGWALTWLVIVYGGRL